MHKMTILSGRGKDGAPEQVSSLTLSRGVLYTIVGNTGSGKSRLIKDIEQLADGDSLTGRRILLDGQAVPLSRREEISAGLVAHLGQNMRFVLDTTVEDFLKLHAQCRGKSVDFEQILTLTNRITPEPVSMGENLNHLSGGQSRALMIADVAMICDSPIVLIDEIENAGVDKEQALELLRSQDKLVLVVTHDPHTALMARSRIVMEGGAIMAYVQRTPQEEALYETLSIAYRRQRQHQTLLRKGEHLA